MLALKKSFLKRGNCMTLNQKDLGRIYFYFDCSDSNYEFFVIKNQNVNDGFMTFSKIGFFYFSHINIR